MSDLHFNARSRSGSNWGGVVQGSVARCAQHQFEAGAMEVEVIGDQGRSVLRPGERVHDAVQRPVGVIDSTDAAKVPEAIRRRMWMRIIFWIIALIAIGLTAGTVVTINIGKQSVQDQALVALKTKDQEGVVETTLSDVDWDDGLIYRFQVLLDGKPAMKASYDVLGGTVRLGR